MNIMFSVRFCVALALSVVSLSGARGSHNEAFQLPGRVLQQGELTTVTRLRIANFATLAAANDQVLTEIELRGKVNVTASEEPVMYGAYFLGPSQVQQMTDILSSEMEEIPAAEATLAPVIGFPGRQLKGRSVLDSLNDMQPRRIPTIFAPFYSGYKFELEGRTSPPGTTLHLSNMTFMVANATYESLATSGIMDYFNLKPSARVCMTNSMLVLESCKGFAHNTFHMWCCTKRQCNIMYTEQAIEDLGYPMLDTLEILTCHERIPEESEDDGQGEQGEHKGARLSAAAITSIVTAAVLVMLVLYIVFQGKRRASAARAAAAGGRGSKVIDQALGCSNAQERGTVQLANGGYSPPLSPAWEQITDSGLEEQVQCEALKLSMPPALRLGSSTHSGPDETHSSVQTTHSSMQAHASKDSSLRHHPPIATGPAGVMHGNMAAPMDVGYRVPPPAFIRPNKQRPQPGPPLSGSYVAHQAFSDSGAVGQAAAPESTICALRGVATRDSVTNYDTESVSLVPPAAGASKHVQEWKEHLERQLDSVLGRRVRGTLRVLPGLHNRLQGGQAVVQIVEDTSSSLQYAIKFFLSTEAFQQEKSLYSDPSQPLGRFLPQLHAIVEGEEGALRDAQGFPLPPCIIMEKGEALDVWIDTSGEKIDLFTGLQVLSHIADRLIDLHAAGYVHRDIKPGNIMWLPRTKRWTLIDFGCAAATGSFARTGFSLYYAAPEALKAYMGGEVVIEATEALDAWSLGVMAIELLNGKHALDPFHDKEETIEMILGDKPAPWEDPKTARAMLRPLGIFKTGVLRLLERDPSKRSTIQQFQQACRRSLANSTITAKHS